MLFYVLGTVCIIKSSAVCMGHFIIEVKIAVVKLASTKEPVVETQKFYLLSPTVFH